MLSRLRFLLVVVAAAAALPGVAAKTPVPGTVTSSHVQLSWILPEAFGDSEGREHAALLIEPEHPWHLSWKNPGDVGAPPRVSLTLQGAVAGDVAWPAPQPTITGPLTTYTYNGATALMVPLHDVEGDEVRGEATVEWLACAADACEPGRATIAFTRAIQPGASAWNTATRARRDTMLALAPLPLAQAPWQLTAAADDDTVTVTIAGLQGTPPTLIAATPGMVSTAVPTLASGSPPRLTFARTPSTTLPATLAFLATAADGRVFEGDVVVVETLEPIAATVTTATTTMPTAPKLPSLAFLLLSAFLGGLLLNLMPCVLPVLSIKFMSFAQSNEGGRLRDALAYTAGVLATFAVLGGGVILLSALGSKVGWGFQLQSPVVVFALAMLFFMMALNFLGVFELGFFAMNIAGNTKATSAFSTGMLSVFVAAPCTGPFMGTALGATAVLPAWAAMSSFLALGAGLASPFVVLALSPRLLSFVPRPGRWMDRLKQFFAFPLLATVAWLGWVLGAQTGTDGWLMLMIGMLVVAFALWLGRQDVRAATVAGWIFGVVGVIGSGVVVKQLSSAPTATVSSSPAASGEMVFAHYDETAIAAARARGVPVFIDFTARWCITCQVNKRAVLATSAGQALFRKYNVALFEADWTNEDETITAALAAFGRNSVPLYVVYPAGGGEPLILPQTLTMDLLETAFLQRVERLPHTP